ncbi:MAG: HD-GYP domain-containing protein [Eubacterium sp.]
MKEINIEEILYEDLNAEIRHGILVSNLAYNLAKYLDIPEEETYELAVAGMVHDIGKLRLAGYLYGRSDDTLAVEEMKYVRMHSKLSYDILKNQGYSEYVQEAVLRHHENYDGSGFPDNLSGDDIHRGGRILRVCDVFAALISERPYRKAFDFETAVALMIDEVKNFDMQIFIAFQRMIHEIDIYKLIGSEE